jgi:hypothetical protein
MRMRFVQVEELSQMIRCSEDKHSHVSLVNMNKPKEFIPAHTLGPQE